MNFLETETSKAVRWFRNFATLLESGEAELAPSSLSREDYGKELRLCGTIVPSKMRRPPSPPNTNQPVAEVKNSETKIEGTPLPLPLGRMSPAQAQQCYSTETRMYTCPKCSKFTTKSETGLKKHYNRCKS